MIDFIVCCDCPHITQYCIDAYRIMAKSREYPDIYRHGKTYALLNRLPMDTNVYNFVQELISGKKKYAYYIAANENGDIVAQWNLLSGAKLVG